MFQVLIFSLLRVLNIHFSFNGINYTDHPNTINEHFRSQLGNIDNKVFVVGGGYASTSNKQTEASFDRLIFPKSH